MHLILLVLQAVVVPPDSGETHLRNIRQLTFGGQNAEAYWSASGRQLILQRQPPEDSTGCDQEYIMNADGTGLRRVSRSEEHTSELQSRLHLVCRLLLEKKTHAHRRPVALQ